MVQERDSILIRNAGNQNYERHFFHLANSVSIDQFDSSAFEKISYSVLTVRKRRRRRAQYQG
jgi:hypothetical protein